MGVGVMTATVMVVWVGEGTVGAVGPLVGTGNA